MYMAQAPQSYGADSGLGISFKPKKLLRKVGRGARKVGRGVKKVGKVAVNVAALPIRLQMKVLTKAMIPFARGICGIPEPILRVSATAAGVEYNIVPVFCQAVKIRNMREIRKLLPPMIKLAVKVSATTAVPGLGPVLAVAKFIPGLKQFAGPDDGVETMQALQILDESGMDEIAGAVAEMSDNELLGELTLSPKVGRGIAIGFSTVAAGLGFWFAFS